MFSKVWKAVKEVAIGVLLVLSLWLVIGGALKKDIGNLSDWISAACNIVMAYAAFKAFTFAKDYFTDVIKKDGYELAKMINTDLLPQLEKNLDISDLFYLSYSVPTYVKGGIGLFQSDGEDSNLRESLKNDLDKLYIKIRIKIKLEKEMLKSVEDLEIYGWKMKTHKKTKINDIVFLQNELFQSIHSIANYLSEILSRDPSNFLPSINSPFIDYDNQDYNSPLPAQNIELIVQRCLLHVDRIVGNQQTSILSQLNLAIREYYNDGKHLKNYFIYTKD